MTRTRIFNVSLAALAFAAAAACSADTDAQSGGPPVPFKLGTFERNGQAFVGLVLKDSQIADIGPANAAFESANASAPKMAAPGDMRFEAMDTNHDGRITRDEWTGSNQSFVNHDWNGDGVLSGDELRTGGQRTTDYGTADHPPNRYEREISWTEQGFHDLDHNRDGRLTANEWHFDLETFRRIDRNRDNAISVGEFLGANRDDDRDDRFDDLDSNNDGRVTRNEWHAIVLVEIRH